MHRRWRFSGRCLTTAGLGIPAWVRACLFFSPLLLDSEIPYNLVKNSFYSLFLHGEKKQMWQRLD